MASFKVTIDGTDYRVDNVDTPEEADAQARSAIKAPQVREQTLMESAGDIASNVGQWFQGKGDYAKSEFDYPELSRMEAARMRKPSDVNLPVATSLARSETGKLNIAKTRGHEGGMDKYGNAYIQTPEGPRYLNKPGASGQDLYDIALEGITDMALTYFGARGGKGVAGTPGQIIGAGLGGSSAILAKDTAGRVAGSNETTDPYMMAFAAAFGMAGEAAGMVIPIAWRWAKSHLKRGSEFMDEAGELTQQGRQTLKRFGVDATQLDKDGLLKVEQLINEGAAADDIAAQARKSRLDEFNIRGSRGDYTQDPKMQKIEEDILNTGKEGDAAQSMMQSFREGQAGDVTAARQALEQQVSGGSQKSVGEGIDAARNAMVTARTAEQKAVSAAYKEADELGGRLTAEGVSELDNLVKGVLKDFTIAKSDPLHTLAKEVTAMKRLFAQKNVRAKGVPLDTIEKWRQRVGKRYKPDGSPESAAVLAVQRQLDGLMDDALNDVAKNVVSGKPVAISAMKTARELARKKILRWDSDKVIKNMLAGEAEMVGDDITRVFVLNPSEAAKKLFGVAGQPSIGAEKALRRMKSILGKDSAEWAAFRGEALFKLFPTETAGKNSEAIIQSSNKFVRNFNKGLKETPEYFDTMFGADLPMMKRFAGALEDIGTKRAGVQNFSNSFNVLARNTGVLGRVIAHYADKFIGPISKLSDAATATSGTIPKKPFPAGLLSGPSAAAGAEYYEEQN